MKARLISYRRRRHYRHRRQQQQQPLITKYLGEPIDMAIRFVRIHEFMNLKYTKPHGLCKQVKCRKLIVCALFNKTELLSESLQLQLVWVLIFVVVLCFLSACDFRFSSTFCLRKFEQLYSLDYELL